MNRKDGYYWIKFSYTNWIIGEWVSSRWNIIGTEQQYTDDDLIAIDETLITRKRKPACQI